MIISHKYKFIFIKTRKTAGTSIEIALSKFCDTGDIITPITKEDEDIRRNFGYKGPQNYHVPLKFYSKLDLYQLLIKKKRKRFFNHASASYIQENIDDDIWKNYFKFCFERNPFDRAISHYYWRTKQPRPEMEKYIHSVPIALLSNWNLYTINDHIAVDFVGHYEYISDDLEIIRKRIGLSESVILPKVKGGYRLNREHYSKVINPHIRSRIELVCAKEIKAFDYRWRVS